MRPPPFLGQPRIQRPTIGQGGEGGSGGQPFEFGFNMLTLWLMGRYLEPILRARRFLAVYLISALGGGTLFVLLAFPAGQGPGGTGSNWNTAVVR